MFLSVVEVISLLKASIFFFFHLGRFVLWIYVLFQRIRNEIGIAD